jgi:hypothetical protein
MKQMPLLIFILTLIHFGNANAQVKIGADPGKWTSYNCKATFSDGIIHLVNTAGKPALLWANNVNFRNGVIELDIKGKDVRGESFVGVAFHSRDNDHYDAIYFRPFNFLDPERKDRAVQYIDLPDNDWSELREKFPGKYEHAVNPVPDPNDWFHVKIVVNFPAIKVYLNYSENPTLEVDKLNKRTEGKIGLWIDSEDGWFKNVSITRSDL